MTNDLLKAKLELIRYIIRCWQNSQFIESNSIFLRSKIKSLYAVLWEITYFPPENHFPTDEMWNFRSFMLIRWQIYWRATYISPARPDHDDWDRLCYICKVKSSLIPAISLQISIGHLLPKNCCFVEETPGSIFFWSLKSWPLEV